MIFITLFLGKIFVIVQFSWLTLGLTVGEAGNKPNTLPAYRIDANTFAITKTSNSITK